MSEMSEKWTDAQLKFIEWMALPKLERKPKTLAQFAALPDIQVEERTLYRWKQLPGFRDAVSRMAKESMQDDVADVLGAIRNNAKKGSIAHINMFLSMTGLAADVEAAGKGPIGDSDAARSRLFAELTRRVAAAQSTGTTGSPSGSDPE